MRKSSRRDPVLLKQFGDIARYQRPVTPRADLKGDEEIIKMQNYIAQMMKASAMQNNIMTEIMLKYPNAQVYGDTVIIHCDPTNNDQKMSMIKMAKELSDASHEAMLRGLSWKKLNQDVTSLLGDAVEDAREKEIKADRVRSEPIIVDIITIPEPKEEQS